MADARRLARAIGLFTLMFESALTVVLGLRFWLSYEETFWVGMWNGLFHTISAFNNAGFGLQPTNIVPYAQDPIMSLGICLLIISGGLGFPVWLELRDQVRPAASRRRLSVHSKVMLVGTGALLVAGTLTVLVFEWSNPATLGQWDDEPMRKLMPAFFQGVTPRTAGFNSVDYSQMHEETWLTQMMLMFVGGGPASTAGGIKVTSFVVLLAFVWSQARGASDTNLFGRRMPTELIRITFTIAFLAMNAVVIGCLVIMLDADYPLSQVLFESISAFGTVGLSTGITFDLPDLSKYVLIALMFVGRTGPYTLALAFALRRIPVKHRYAEESPIVA